MAFKISANTVSTNDGIPFLWGSGNQTTVPTYQSKITPTNPTQTSVFGGSCAINNSRIVIGASNQGIDGNNSGVAYLFDASGNLISTLLSSDRAAGDAFGQSVAIGSGQIVIGASRDDDLGDSSGSAYIFSLSGTQLTKIKASDGATDDLFGNSVAIGNGRIVVGANGDDDNGLNSGSAYIFSLSGTQLTKIKASDGAAGDAFGYSVAIGNGRIIVGAFSDDDNGSSSGSAYIFSLSGTQLTKIKASDGESSDLFGQSVAVGSGRIVVGAKGDDDLGSGSGAAYIFDLNGNQLAKIKASDGAAFEQFGQSVAVGDGRIVVGSVNVNTSIGAAYIFDLDGNQLAKITTPDTFTDDAFGYSVAIGSGRIVVGATDTFQGLILAGSAYIYTTPLVYNIYDAIEQNSYGQ